MIRRLIDYLTGADIARIPDEAAERAIRLINAGWGR